MASNGLGVVLSLWTLCKAWRKFVLTMVLQHEMKLTFILHCI